MIRLACCLVCLSLVACGDDDSRMGSDAGPGGDVGPGVDTGPRPDTGPQPDTGPRPDTGPLPMSPLVDPMCVDGMYTETLPDTTSDISDIAFTGDVGAYVDAVLSRRYPIGGALVVGGRMDGRFGAPCDELFAGSPSSGEDVINRLNVIVHECGHIYDGFLSSRSTNVYAITDTLQLSCDRGDSTDRGGDTFARSRIRNDEFSADHPPCGGAGGDCDGYADIYLNGDPDDGTFEGGDQGFNLLFDETVQYVNSIAMEWAIVDQMPPGRRTSARDGILTFLWYTMRYLRMARLEYPGAYARIAEDACWRNAILTVWGRAWLFLEITDGMTPLAIDPALDALATDPVLVEEIQRLRDLEGC
mgnify:CR=1 FL=1